MVPSPEGQAFEGPEAVMLVLSLEVGEGPRAHTICSLNRSCASYTLPAPVTQPGRAKTEKPGRRAYLLVPGGHGALHVLVAGEEGHDAVGDHGRHLQQEVPIVPDHRCEGSEVAPSAGLGPLPHSLPAFLSNAWT